MLDSSRVRRASDPLILKGRKSRFRPAIAALTIGSIVLGLSYRDSQASLGEQRREAIITSRVVEKDHSFKLNDDVVLSVTIFLTSGSSWIVPSDCIKIDIVDCIGAGGNGSATGRVHSAGAAWARITNLSVAPGSSITIGVGKVSSANNDTYFNATSLSNAAALGSSVACAAEGGINSGTTIGAIGRPGLATNSVGTSKFSGGAIWTANIARGASGAAGPNGDGVSAAGSPSFGPGSAGDAGFGGAGGAGGGGAGGNGTEYDASHGSGGGAGAPSSGVGGNGGLYGGGGSGGSAGAGIGGQGLIVIVYTPFIFAAIPRQRHYLRR